MILFMTVPFFFIDSCVAEMHIGIMNDTTFLISHGTFVWNVVVFKVLSVSSRTELGLAGMPSLMRR